MELIIIQIGYGFGLVAVTQESKHWAMSYIMWHATYHMR